MKALIVFLYMFFSFGIEAQCDKFEEISEIRAQAEISLNIATNNHYNGIQLFFSLLPVGDSICQVKLLDGDKLYYTDELKKITQPFNEWIVQTSKNVRLLDNYLKQVRRNNDYKGIDFDFDNKLIDSFLGECNLPFHTDKHKRSINTNDIYEYQNLINLEKGASKDFQCGDGAFIDLNRTCDGNFDCWDGTDELGACEETVGCQECSGSCVTGPRGPQCVAECPVGFGPPVKFCSSSRPCYHVCVRRNRRKAISAKCLVQIFPNLLDTTNEKYFKLIDGLHDYYRPKFQRCMDYIDSLYKSMNLTAANEDDSFEVIYTPFDPTTRDPTWNPTTRHPTWHPTWHPTTSHPTWHPTWHPTTRHTTWHPTWHPTTRHPTYHPTTSHPTWHPTTRHPTWHPTTRHPTWHPTWRPTTRHPTYHPTTRHPTWNPTTSHPTWHPTWHPTTRHPTWHPTWHPTTRHPTYHPTTSHPTWHPTTRHPTWHPTTRHPTWHPTWHPTTRHPTWHPTTRHTTWHTTTRPTTWDPVASKSIWDSNESDDSTQLDENKHHTTKHTTPHSTTTHTRHTTRHHTTKHTTKHTTHHTTTPPTTTTTPTKSTTSPTTTTTTSDRLYAILQQ